MPSLFPISLFPLIHLKRILPLKTSEYLWVCVSEGSDATAERAPRKKLQWWYCPRPPPPSAGSPSAAPILDRLHTPALSVLSGLGAIYLFFFLLMNDVFIVKYHVNAEWFGYFIGNLPV